MSVMTTHQRQKNRGGVSLLEILICVGILSIGLLGVAALIPAGHFAVVETTKADRSVACAKAAKAEVQVREMLAPEHWCVWWNTSGNMYLFYSYNWARNHTNYGPGIRGATVVIDPFGLTNCMDNSATNPQDPLKFPYSMTSGLGLTRFTTRPSIFNKSASYGEPTGINFSALGTKNILLPFNERIYRWADDIVIDVDDTDPDKRPCQMFTFDSGDFGPYPGTAGTPILRESKGDYSWFLTVTPLNDYNKINGTVNIPKPVDEMKSFEVSTIVCYKRDLSFDVGADIPAERIAEVAASFTGISGAGASDIPLMCPTGTSADELEYLDVKPGQWIMLVGRVRDAALDYFDTNPQSGYRTIAKWYRVLSVDDEMTDNNPNNIRWITVTGPEWIPGTNPGQMQNTRAIIVESVIGVFTETMTLDR